MWPLNPKPQPLNPYTPKPLNPNPINPKPDNRDVNRKASAELEAWSQLEGRVVLNA